MNEYNQGENLDFDKYTSQERVKLIAGIPKKLRITGVRQDSVTFTEKDVEKIVPSLVFKVTEEDGSVLTKPKEFSVTSKQLIKELKEKIKSKELFERVIQITKTGEKFDTNYKVELVV